jgi:hypothetical protein
MMIQLPDPLGRPRRGEYTSQDFLFLRESDGLVLSPKFQRRQVWNLPQRSYFIDTLIRGLPVPPLFLREVQAEDFSRLVREVVDGQQRLRSVLDFADNKYAVSRSIGAPWSGMRFRDLPAEAQQRILNYHFSCETFEGISDSSVLDIFARMNTYSTPLNKQELRNGKYFGAFKQLSVRLAREYLEFWRENRIFTEQAIARMLEVELVSELLILSLNGPQDKKTSIDHYYADYDDELPSHSSLEESFRTVMDEISESMGDVLYESEFRRVPLFYSLYGALYHRMFGIANLELPTPERRLRTAERDSLANAIAKLSTLVEAGRGEEEEVPKKYQAFVTACLRQTDNLQPRLRRLRTVYTESNLA